jgi:hypothetical protein
MENRSKKFIEKIIKQHLSGAPHQEISQQIGEKFGLSCSAVSKRVSIFKDLLKKNQALRNKVHQIKAQIKI